MSKKHPIQLSDHFTYSRLFRFVLPSIVMMVFTSIYGVVDGLFVSNFAGKTAFASINLIMPFLIILGAMGFMLGTGGTALVSRVLGEGDKEHANKYFSMITLFGILLGVILTVVGVLWPCAQWRFCWAQQRPWWMTACFMGGLSSAFLRRSCCRTCSSRS